MDANVIKRDEEELYTDLGPEDVRERGEALANVLEEIRLMEEDAKDTARDFKQQIKVNKERAKKLGDATRFHRELRIVPVEIRDAGEGQVTVVRTDNGEVVRTRKMTDEEKQLTVLRLDEQPAPEKKSRATAKA
jgi:hypothetical protein